MPVATEGTIEHMKENASPAWLDTIWAPRFPGQIYQPFTFAEPLPKDGRFKLQGTWTRQAVECGITDTHNTTVLWVPDLRLVAGGDVIYGACYQMLAYTNTPALRAEWIKAIDKVRKEQRKATIEGDVQTYTDLLLGNADGTKGIFDSAAKRPDILQYMLVLTGDLIDGV